MDTTILCLSEQYLRPELHSRKSQLLITEDDLSAFATRFFEALFESMERQSKDGLITELIFYRLQGQRKPKFGFR